MFELAELDTGSEARKTNRLFLNNSSSFFGFGDFFHGRFGQ